jgi:toxin ParE1/3/4
VNCRLTKEAEADIARILRRTKKLFGALQVSTYAEIVEGGIAMIAADPVRPSSVDRSDLRPGVRSFHLELVTRRRHSASHMIYFKEMRSAYGDSEVVVIGVLSESMEPKRRLNKALRGLETEKLASPPEDGEGS